MNFVHLRVHENQYCSFDDISNWLFRQFEEFYVVQEDADADVKRTHIHATIHTTLTYIDVVKILKAYFPKLKGRTDFGGHDIKDLQENNQYCCKGKSKTDMPVILAVKGKYDRLGNVQFIEYHRLYWEKNAFIKTTKNVKQKCTKSWSLDLAERLKKDRTDWENDIRCNMIVYIAMMKEMSETAKKLGAKNFREIHRGIMNHLCPAAIRRDTQWLMDVFPEFDQDIIQRFF